MPGLEVVVFIGLQGAGKSTFRAQRFAASHLLISKDLFRNNRRPERRQQTLIREALATGRSIVIDNTNPSRADRATTIALARSFEVTVIGYFFASPLEDCLARNAARPPQACVPERGVLATARRLERPCLAEGFDQLWTVRTLADQQFEITPYLEMSDESR